MPDETIKPRLDAIDQQLDQAREALDKIRKELDITDRIESANAREIQKLKAQVAVLQAPPPTKGPRATITNAPRP